MSTLGTATISSAVIATLRIILGVHFAMFPMSYKLVHAVVLSNDSLYVFV